MYALDIENNFYDWLNEIDDYAWDKADRLGISTVEVVGLRPDAPESARYAFKEFVETHKWARERGVHV
jgi:hypothetical protein